MTWLLQGALWAEWPPHALPGGKPQLTSCSLSWHFKGIEFVVADSEGSSPETNTTFCLFLSCVVFAFLNLAMAGKKGHSQCTQCCPEAGAGCVVWGAVIEPFPTRDHCTISSLDPR